MRIEPEWLWHSRNNASRGNQKRPFNLESSSRINPRTSLQKTTKLEKVLSKKDSQWISNVSLPSLDKLKNIKKEKLHHIKVLIKNDCYDTPDKLKITAQKIVDLLLAEGI